MAGNRLACRDCHHIANPDASICPVCGSSSLTEDWSGYVIVTNPEKSEIAHAMEVARAGKYALKVR